MPLTRDHPSPDLFSRRSTISWIMYDWANSAFALTVMAAFFPVFFKKYYCLGHEASFSTIRLNLGNAIGGLCIAALGPLLGALADVGGSRKKFLLGFMLLGATATGTLPLVGQGNWGLALAIFIVANVGFSSANMFYDSLLPSVASADRMDRISSLGYAWGYLGCAVLFGLNLIMVRNPAAFGFADKVQAIRASFMTVSAWWIIFSIPLWLWVKEPPAEKKTAMREAVRRGLAQLSATIADLRRRRVLWLFLLAYWLYIDGVHTFIRAAADLGLSIGIDENKLLVALLIVQLVAFPAAYVFGIAAQRFGAPRALMAGIGMYLFVTLVGPLTVKTPLQFGVFAALQALPLGALQALSRSYYAKLIPAGKSAEYFGFFDLIGKFAVFTGPVVVAAVVMATRSWGATSAQAARWGCSSLSIFFVAGALLLTLSTRSSKERS